MEKRGQFCAKLSHYNGGGSDRNSTLTMKLTVRERLGGVLGVLTESNVER
jgi:hypothetical protein